MADIPQITVVPDQDPDQTQFSYALRPTTYRTSPYNIGWWQTETAPLIPQESIGWLVAQGWKIVSIEPDPTTNPPTQYYNLTRQSLDNWSILSSLLNEWTNAHNDATYTNAVRYNDVVGNWESLISSTHTYLSTQVDEQNVNATSYLTDLGLYMDAVELLIGDNDDQWTAAGTAAATLLTQGQTDHDTFSTTYDSLVDQLETDYDDFEVVYETLLGTLVPDYTPHADTTRTLLIDLGTTELARINETFAASLATQTQQLVDRGLYSSAVLADITAKNARDRDEAISALNDKLNRANLANEHQLYGQLVGVRDKSLTGRERMHGQLTAMRDKTLAGKDRLEAIGQDVLRWRHARTLQDTEVETGGRSRVIAESMNSYAARQAGLAKVNDDLMATMRYSMEKRNELIVGLYGFVERREDVYPNFESLVGLATGLGDAGGGWVTP